MSQAAESSGAAAAKAAEADEEPFNPTESEYKLMLLEHWRERIAGGSDALPEHDVGVNAKMRAVHRKKRKQAGHCHPMFDVAPPTFLQQYQADPSSFECDFAGMGWGDGEEDEDSAAVDSQRLQTAAAKKARSSVPLMRRYTDASLMPFGNGPFASERRQAWAATMKLVGQRYRDMFKQVQTFQMDAKKCVQMCQKRYRKDALASLKAQRDFAVRARKVSKDAGTIWRRENAQKLAAEGRLDSSALSSGDISKSRREAREVMERKRMEEAERERVRQQKRINFLLTQTELFAHFIGQKMGGITEDKGSEDASDLQPVPAAPEGEAAGGAKSKEAQMMAAAKEKGKLDKTETREALASAQAALKQRQNAMHSFDEETREATKNKGLSKKESAALAGSLDDAALQHTDVNVTAETASIFTGTLKSYQKIGFNWLVGLYEQGLNGILADEMGLGKTVQTIALLTHLSESKGIWGPFLVVAPTSTMHNWYSELQKFCPQMKVIPYFGANPNERKLLRRMWTNPVDLGTPDAAFHVLVTNYKLIIADEKHFARVQWQYMVLDEAQAVKNSASQRWKTLLGFNCRNRLLLTGTPIQNSMAELWALLHFIMPELFDSFSDFTEWFSKDIESSASGDGKGLDAAQLKRLQLILQPFMLRRTKKDVLDELVQKVEIEMRTPLSTRQRYYYDVLKNRVKATATSTELSKDEKRLHSLMNLVMQFRKVCNHPEIFERRDFVSPLQISQYVLPALPPPPTDMVVVNVVNHSTISLHLPALVYDDVAARAYWCLLNAGSRTRILTTLLSPWAVDALHRSFFPSSCPAPPPAAEEYSGMRRKGAAFAAAAAAAAAARRHAQLVHERGGGLSCVRLSGLSEGEAAFLAWASPAQRWLASLALLSREVARRAVAVYEDDECKGAGAAGIVGKAGRAEVGMPGWRSRKLPDIVLPWRAGDMEREWEGELVASASRRLHDMAPVLHVTRALTTTPQAAPARIECSRRVCMRRQAEALEDAWTRRLLLGGFASGDSPLSWQNALSCAYLAPHSLQTIPAPWPAWPSLMQSLHARIGSNSIRKPDMSKLVSDSGKLRLLDSILPKLKAGRHKVLMFCQMTKMMDILEDYFWFRKHMYLRLDGSASIADRRDMVNEFQAEDSDYFLFLLSTRAGGLGINLTAADTVIFYDSDWNPTMDAQAMDRAHRLGQTRQVTVYRLVSKNTIEERILHRAKQKDSIQRMVISGDQASAAFKGQGDSFKATDFADLLFEEEEEEEKDKEKQADVADSTLSKGRVARAPEKTQDSAAADASQKAEGAGASNGVSDDNTDVAVDATCASDKHNSKAANGSVPSGAANGAQDSAAAPAPAVDTTGATVEEGDVEELCDWLKVGCKVEVEWDGEWWEAIVRKIIVTAKGKTGKVEIDYVGGEEQEAEWIEISYTKLLGWVSTRVRELEPHPEPADAGPERLTVSVGGVTIGGGDVDKKSAADQKARDQMALASARSGPAIIMDMDD